MLYQLQQEQTDKMNLDVFVFDIILVNFIYDSTVVKEIPLKIEHIIVDNLYFMLHAISNIMRWEKIIGFAI